ncbi:MAG: hypothetical protein LBF56_00175 [Holosporales bacterium]|nr:hypothetical protein [Holosporales bacterium]
MTTNRVNNSTYIYIFLYILLSTITCSGSIVCNSDTTITSGNTVTVGDGSTITVTPGKVLTIGGKLEIAASVPPPALFIPPNLIDITTITGRENGIAYIGTSDRSIVITKVIPQGGSLDNPDVLFEMYDSELSNGDPGGKFTRDNMRSVDRIDTGSIVGSMEEGYRISNEKFSAASSYMFVEDSFPDTYVYSLAGALTYYGAIDSMADYDPNRWRTWVSVADEYFVHEYPHKSTYMAGYAWVQVGNVPSTELFIEYYDQERWTFVDYYSLFSGELIEDTEVPGRYISPAEPGIPLLRYGTAPYYVYKFSS